MYLLESGSGLEGHLSSASQEYIQVIMHGLEVDTARRCGLLTLGIFICLEERVLLRI